MILYNTHMTTATTTKGFGAPQSGLFYTHRKADMAKILGASVMAFLALVILGSMLPDADTSTTDAYSACMKDPTQRFAAEMRRAELKSNLDVKRIQHVLCGG